MKYTKQPIDLPRQLEALKSRGMVIENEESALQQLSSISYFRLASYWRPMEQDSISRRFYPDTSFDKVMKLYLFDRELRTLVFIAIQDVEIALRTRIIHHFSLKYGAFWFMDESLFKNRAIYSLCLDNMQSELNRTKEEFIQEHFEKYDTPSFPPVWKTLEVVSFGTLSKLYCNMKDVEVKKQIARSFGLPQYLYLESWIRCASVLRNCCAHHARLWNRRFPLMPKLPEKLPLAWISGRPPRPVKLYAQFCYLAYLEQSIHPDSHFKKKLLDLLVSHRDVCEKAMGFPRNWQSEPVWTS